MPVGLGGGSIGDVRPAKVYRTFGPVDPLGWIGPKYESVAAYRTICFYLQGSGGGQLGIQVLWYHEPDFGQGGYFAMRRDPAQNLVIDSPSLPVMAPTGDFIIPLANPGGANAVSLNLIVLAGTPNARIYVSAES